MQVLLKYGLYIISQLLPLPSHIPNFHHHAAITICVFALLNLGTRGDTNGASDGSLKLRSTCHKALDACETDGSCNRFLDQIKRMCDSINCDKQKCMRAIHDFYENIPEKHRLDIAFCLCK